MKSHSPLILVTGANGFIGRALVKELIARGERVRGLYRSRPADFERQIEVLVCPDLTMAKFAELVESADVVVNLAARVHMVKEKAGADTSFAYEAANVDMPFNLAKAAKEAGSSRFIQLSSVAAIASITKDGEVIDDLQIGQPAGDYGKSKLRADNALQSLVSKDFAVVSLRPPAVYGPGVGAFFKKLMNAARMGLPLPLAGIYNARSFIALQNLVDAIINAAHGGPSGSYIVTDHIPVSTSDLYDKLCKLYGHQSRSWALSPALVHTLLKPLLGSRVESLVGNAAFDGHRFRQHFDWSPRISFDTALAETVRADTR